MHLVYYQYSKSLKRPIQSYLPKLNWSVCQHLFSYLGVTLSSKQCCFTLPLLYSSLGSPSLPHSWSTCFTSKKEGNQFAVRRLRGAGNLSFNTVDTIFLPSSSVFRYDHTCNISTIGHLPICLTFNRVPARKDWNLCKENWTISVTKIYSLLFRQWCKKGCIGQCHVWGISCLAAPPPRDTSGSCVFQEESTSIGECEKMCPLIQVNTTLWFCVIYRLTSELHTGYVNAKKKVPMITHCVLVHTCIHIPFFFINT